MAVIKWASAASGDFNDAADWTGGVVPGPSDDASIDVAGAYTVTISSDESESVASLAVDNADATLEVNGALSVGSSFSLEAGAVFLDGTITNDGTINVTGGTFGATGSSTIVNNGTIEADGGSFYAGYVGSTIVGGTIVSPGAAFIPDGGTLDGVTYEGTLTMKSGELNVLNGLTITGADGAGPGVINLSDGDTTYDDELLFLGGGTLDNATVNIGGDGYYNVLGAQNGGNSDSPTLTLGPNLDVVHIGTFAQIGGVTLINEGTINAGFAGGTLRLAGQEFVNDGSILVSNGDTLELLAVPQCSQSSTGVISVGTGSTADLTDAWIDGGRIETSGSGTFVAAGRLDGLGGAAPTTDAAALMLEAGATLELAGSILNTGAIAVAAGGPGTGLLIEPGGASLSGTGSVSLAGGHDKIVGASASATLTNANTISGAGDIGQGSLTLINEAGGVIDGVGATSLQLDTAGETLVNDGLIEDTGGAGLEIENTTIDGAGGGTIAGAGGVVRLLGADLIGGTLAGGPIRAVAGTNVIDGTTSAVTITGRLGIVDGQGATLRGAIDNAGVVAMGGAAAKTTLTVGAPGLTLTGAGQVLMDDSAENLIVGTSSSTTLTNDANTIAGSGDIGGGSMTLINEAGGVIAAEFAAPLILDTGANAIVNAGIIEASGSGGATIKSAVVNSGVLKAEGGDLTFDAAVTGAGRAVIQSGAITFASTFSEAVAFTGPGELILSDSEGYGGTIRGFSTTGADSLDLEDIAYAAGTTTAKYVGTAAGGVLTVTSGTEVAEIHFTGNYLASVWTLSAAPGGGTLVVDPATRATGRMIQAMAGLGARSAHAAAPAISAATAPRLLATPGGTQV